MSAISQLSNFIASVATQIRAAIQVGVPVGDGAKTRRTDDTDLTRSPSEWQLWDEAPGRMTRNGLGSLEIGAGKTRIDE